MIEEGRFIEATTTDNQVNAKIEPGLPNVRGSLDGRKAHAGWQLFGELPRDEETAKSAGFKIEPPWFLNNKDENGNYCWQHHISNPGLSNDAARQMGIDLSLANPIYGNSQTVQPKSIRAKIWIRKS